MDLKKIQEQIKAELTSDQIRIIKDRVKSQLKEIETVTTQLNSLKETLRKELEDVHLLLEKARDPFKCLSKN